MSKKYVLPNFMLQESGAFKDYLEAMALEGWMLENAGNLLMRFTACEPRRVRYCVEVMEHPSVYASNQTPEKKGYREFCQDAGWDYLGCCGYFHIFRTEDPDAVDVETDPRQRYEHILQAGKSQNKMLIILFTAIAALNLLSCLRAGTLLISNGLCILLLLLAAVYTIGSFSLWTRRADISLETCGILPRSDWKRVRRKNMLWLAGLLSVAVVYIAWLFAAETPPEYLPYVLLAFALWLAFFFLLMFFFYRLLRWLREKKTFSRKTNILIYWGAALILFFVLLGIILLILMVI